MTTPTKSTTDRILYKKVLGSRRLSNYVWATVISMGGVGFLLSGLSSYYKINFLLISDPTPLIFFPQGLAMTLYGVAGTLVGLYIWLTVLWDLGAGYNEFNADTHKIKIFRWGFPGKNRKLELEYDTSDLQSIRVEVKEGVNPRREIYLKFKNRREVPLTRVGQPISLSELENQAAELAKFLAVPLEGL
jgi:hypothetical protein